MRVLVVGGTGLIGRATLEMLHSRGAAVTLVSRRRPSKLPPGVPWLECDISDAGCIQRITSEVAPDAVLHLAALLQFACDAQPALATRINVDGTLHVLEAARLARVPRVVFGSSIAVYGQTDETMREEGWPFRSTGLYGVTKLMGESLGARYQAEFGLQFVALRYSGVFGREDEQERAASAGMSLVRKQILQCARGEDVAVTGASGAERIHLTHVSDAAEATCLALLHPTPGHVVYNVAGPKGNHVTLRQLHDAVRAAVPNAGRALWSGAGKTAGPVDTSRIEQDLGFVPRMRVAEGVRHTLGTDTPMEGRISTGPPPQEREPQRI